MIVFNPDALWNLVLLWAIVGTVLFGIGLLLYVAALTEGERRRAANFTLRAGVWPIAFVGLLIRIWRDASFVKGKEEKR